jgi:dipeptidyl aminopeptidase/acylaminoacyl peptidase
MTFTIQLALSFALASFCCGGGLAVSDGHSRTRGSEHKAAIQRFATVEDSVRMTTIDNPNYGLGTWGRDEVAAFSPYGKRFVVITKSGNLERNTIDYKLLLYVTGEHPASSVRVLAAMSSSSLQPAIESVRWVDDHTIAFLGERPRQTHQLYRIDLRSKRLQRLTEHPTNLAGYALNHRGDLFFTAEKPKQRTWHSGDQFIVEHENLKELLCGSQVENLAGLDLFEKSPGMNKVIRIRTRGLITGFSALWPSPDGRYLALRTVETRNSIPADWLEYKTVSQNTLLSEAESSKVEEYELIDLRTGKSQPLIDAPLGAWYSNLVWSRDSRSVVISGTNLPLAGRTPSERDFVATNLFVAEVSIANHKVTRITSQDAIIRHWDKETSELVLQVTDHRSYSNFEEGRLIRFRKTSEEWTQIPKPDADEPAQRLKVAVEEDMNTPPSLVAIDTRTGKKSILLHPNPQFPGIRFGRVEELRFEADDHAVRVGIYHPPDYIRGKRYPLVIQTHGWTSDRFWVDGPYTSSMAAQALAAKGFVVVQVDDDVVAASSTASEAKQAALRIDEIIDHLSADGIVDPDQIGIVAFSASGPGVAYAIAHGRHHFRAAVLCDTDDAGYFTYLSSFNVGVGLTEQFESINGGAPFGTGLLQWIKEAPEFSLNDVHTALRLEAHSGITLLMLWEWFVGARRLHKPVEMVYMPGAGHVATKPRDRLTSQEGAVDWFDFWLKGEEDPAPAKRKQYARWRQLQSRNEK